MKHGSSIKSCRVWKWKYPQSSCKKKLKTQPSAGKLMHSVLRLTRPSTGTYQGKGTTINSAWYSEMITDKLKPAIQSKCWGLLLKGVVLLRDNARPHTAEMLLKLKFEIKAHPLYSPDLAPSHLFGPLKEALRGRRFNSEGSSACVAHCSAENLFGGHQEACARMDQVHWKARGLRSKMMLM